MGKKIIIANFKAELSENELSSWLRTFLPEYRKGVGENKTVILCPSTIHLSMVSKEIAEAGTMLFLGAQDVSQFERGTYTGEVVASEICRLAHFVIIGHSERRRHLGESKEMIARKIEQAHNNKLSVILCMEQAEQYTEKVYAVAYEPALAIGNGNPISPSEAHVKINEVKKIQNADHYLYGGSVNSENVKDFIQDETDGVLVGKHCLDPHDFLKLIQNA